MASRRSHVAGAQAVFFQSGEPTRLPLWIQGEDDEMIGAAEPLDLGVDRPTEPVSRAVVLTMIVRALVPSPCVDPYRSRNCVPPTTQRDQIVIWRHDGQALSLLRNFSRRRAQVPAL
jgi:hypothetical protein